MQPRVCLSVLGTPFAVSGERRTCEATSLFCAVAAQMGIAGKESPVLEIGAGLRGG